MLKKVNSIISKYKGLLYILTLLFFIVAIFDLIGVSLLLNLLNLIMESETKSKFYTLISNTLNVTDKELIILIAASLLVIFSIMKNLFKYFTFKFQFNIIKNLHTHISSKISWSYSNSDFHEFQKHNPQTLIKSSIDTINTFVTFMIIGGLRFISNLLIATLLIGFLLYKDFLMTSGILMIILAVNYIFLKLTKKSNEGLQQERENIIGKMYDGVSNIIYNKAEIFSYKKKEFFNRTFKNQVEKFNLNLYKHNIINSLPQLYSDFLLYFSASIIIITLFTFTLTTSGSLELLVLYAIVMIRIIPISAVIISSYNYIRYHSDSINVIYNLLNIKKEKEYRFIDTSKNIIKINDVNICYDDNEILKNINLIIQKNKKIAFTGATGSGKTTLVKAIAGMKKPSNGKISLYSNEIAYVAQEPYFFDGTLLENIIFDDVNNFNEKKVNKLLKQCLLFDFIEALPNKLDTNIGHRGSSLSGGQKQRLALVRALYFNSDIIILDEVTSALDNNSEYEIRQAIDNINDKTIIMIAHRLSSIKNFDNIFLLDKKKIEDNGNYNDLLLRSSLFKDLVDKAEIND